MLWCVRLDLHNAQLCTVSETDNVACCCKYSIFLLLRNKVARSVNPALCLQNLLKHCICSRMKTQHWVFVVFGHYFLFWITSCANYMIHPNLMIHNEMITPTWNRTHNGSIFISKYVGIFNVDIIHRYIKIVKFPINVQIALYS